MPTNGFKTVTTTEGLYNGLLVKAEKEGRSVSGQMTWELKKRGIKELTREEVIEILGSYPENKKEVPAQ